tara:strand:+ start:7087 stop:7488 length:402 start_codon:yes stop_codon:yes gene_type:complete
MSGVTNYNKDFRMNVYMERAAAAQNYKEQMIKDGVEECSDEMFYKMYKFLGGNKFKTQKTYMKYSQLFMKYIGWNTMCNKEFSAEGEGRQENDMGYLFESRDDAWNEFKQVSKLSWKEVYILKDSMDFISALT